MDGLQNEALAVSFNVRDHQEREFEHNFATFNPQEE